MSEDEHTSGHTSAYVSIPAGNLPPGVRGRAASYPQEVRSLGVRDAFVFGGEEEEEEEEEQES